MRLLLHAIRNRDLPEANGQKIHGPFNLTWTMVHVLTIAFRAKFAIWTSVYDRAYPTDLLHSFPSRYLTKISLRVTWNRRWSAEIVTAISWAIVPLPHRLLYKKGPPYRPKDPLSEDPVLTSAKTIHDWLDSMGLGQKIYDWLSHVGLMSKIFWHSPSFRSEALLVYTPWQNCRCYLPSIPTWTQIHHQGAL